MKAKAIRSISAVYILLFLSLPILARALSSDHRTLTGLTPLFPTEQPSVMDGIPGVADPSFFKEKGTSQQKHINDCYPKKHNGYMKTELSWKRD